MQVPFFKMQGCGNDYIYFDCMDSELGHPENFARQLSDRHFGIGGDGVVLICQSGKADGRMRMFNADGSEGKMCGNAIRCVGKYLYETGRVKKTVVAVETLSGVRTLRLCIKDGSVESVSVQMGKAEFAAKEIPMLLPDDLRNQKIQIGEKEWEVTCVSMGNPHCVVFVDDPEKVQLSEIGPLFEKNRLFPEGVNTEIVSLITPRELAMRVWERGSGETLACGTGACAAAAAAVRRGLCPAEKEIKVRLRGGTLTVCCAQDGRMTMTGTAERVFEGRVELPWESR